MCLLPGLAPLDHPRSNTSYFVLMTIYRLMVLLLVLLLLLVLVILLVVPLQLEYYFVLMAIYRHGSVQICPDKQLQ